MGFLLDRDVLKGSQGSAFITDEDGRNEELFRIKAITAGMEVQSTEIKTMGTTRVQEKPNGAKQTGTMKVYYGSPKFTKMAVDYVTTGKVTYFDVQVVNNDPTTTVGIQSAVFYGCKLTGSIDIAKLDVDSDALEQDLSFSYTDVQIIEAFTKETSYGG